MRGWGRGLFGEVNQGNSLFPALKETVGAYTMFPIGQTQTIHLE